MTKEQIEHFKKILIDEQKEILNDMADSNDTFRTLVDNDLHGVNDAVDIATSKITQDMLRMMSDKSQQTLLKIDAALRRIEEGSFGICVTCKSEISIPRLETLPHAIECMDCKKKKENDAKKR